MSEAASDVLAALLADIGCETFVPDEQGVTAYIQTSVFDNKAIDAIIADFPLEGISITYTSQAAENQNWNELWESSHEFLPIQLPGGGSIEIRPRQAFGTGEHPTTRMMLEYIMEQQPLSGKTVIDAGCGTGILGITCTKLGAAQVYAYDIDEWSVSNSHDNYQRNGLEGNILHGDASVLKQLPQADLILANINRNILLNDLPAFNDALLPNGLIAISGFLADDVELLRQKAETLGLHFICHRALGEWHLLAFEKKAAAPTRILQLLSQNYPDVAAASTEIINLEAILNLPKGTEHFMADIHGEYEAFLHILKNASGNIKRKVRELYKDTLSDEDLRELCALIYYPEQKLELIKAAVEQQSQTASEANERLNTFYSTTLLRLVSVCRSVSSKYTRSKVRKALPQEFAYIIEELLHETSSDDDKQAYYQCILQSIVHTGRADAFIVALADVIQRLAVDQLHILGDIYDRGPGAHIIMDRLCEYHSFDIQWGNHDALWMGAAAGNDCCIANVLRLSLRYGNMATLEDGYGINLVPLATFAMETYANDPCDLFGPRLDRDDTTHNEKTRRLIAQMHKAISIIQFKLEAQMILRRPEWQLQDRLVLGRIDKERGVYVLDGKDYEMTDTFLPTLDTAHPYDLTAEEAELVRQLHHSFRVSEKLQRHIKCLFAHGCMYHICNGNLLFHASVPLNADGTLKEVELAGHHYSGRELLHQIGMIMRSAFNQDTPREDKLFARDYFWYLWCGPDSPLFDKDRMATFERYFLKDKTTHAERKGHYYLLRNNAEVVEHILDAFGVQGKHRHIINGHVPVRVAGGESPIKADGKLMVIDGGLSRAYHQTTGIAGYTLVFHSRGFELIQHEPFTSAQEAVQRGTDIRSSKQIVELSGHRLRVRDTDKGRELQAQIAELKDLLYAYRHGIVTERSRK